MFTLGPARELVRGDDTLARAEGGGGNEGGGGGGGGVNTGGGCGGGAGGPGVGGGLGQDDGGAAWGGGDVVVVEAGRLVVVVELQVVVEVVVVDEDEEDEDEEEEDVEDPTVGSEVEVELAPAGPWAAPRARPTRPTTVRAATKATRGLMGASRALRPPGRATVTRAPASPQAIAQEGSAPMLRPRARHRRGTGRRHAASKAAIPNPQMAVSPTATSAEGRLRP